MDHQNKKIRIRMAKRKASKPAEELMNGDDADARRQSRSSLGMEGSSTPKRSMGNNVLQKTLSFGSPLRTKQIKPRFKSLDGQVSEKMVKLNQAFLGQIVKCTKETPDAIMFPILESYFRHVHNVLTPHLPKYLMQLDEKEGLKDVAKFLDKFKRALGKDDEEEDQTSNNNNTPKKNTTQPKLPPGSFVAVAPNRKLAVPAGTSREEKFGNVFANFSFGKLANTNANYEDMEAEKPPKNEFKAVKEENSVFDIRCKVYGKVGSEIKDKGIGQLYIKKVDGSLDQYQMVVRADNNLGTIILNMRLQRGLTFKLKKKKITTVDHNNGNPTMIFIRVKTEEKANELHKQLIEFSR